MALFFNFLALFYFGFLARHYSFVDSNDSIKEVFDMLFEYMKNHTFAKQFDVSLSKTHLSSVYSTVNGILSIHMFIAFKHMDELCPDSDVKECWCCLFDEELPAEQVTLLKMCSSHPKWIENKSDFMSDGFELFRYGHFPNGTKRMRYGESIQQSYLDSHKAQRTQPQNIAILDNQLWNSYELNRHNSSLCPYGWAWCWCGLVGDIVQYLSAKTPTIMVQSPRIVIDCRPYRLRPYETRDCAPEAKDKLPWYRKAFGPLPRRFPCGHL